MAGNIILRCCNPLNPATLLPLPEDGTPHYECRRVIMTPSKPWKDLKDEPMLNFDLTLYVDGSSYYQDGKHVMGYVVVDDKGVRVSEAMLAEISAQDAELIALIQAAKQGKNR